MIRVHRFAPLAVALAVLGCRSLPTMPSQPKDDPEFERPAEPVQPGMPIDPPPAERLLPGDQLNLHTVSVEPLDVPDLTVDVGGTVHVPVAGPVQISGHTVEEATKLIEAQLHHYDSRAQVQLTLVSAAGHHVTILGAVVTPGVLPITPGLRVADVIAKSGGPLQQVADGEQVDLADLEGARVMRGGTPLPISIARALQGDPLHNVLIHADDMVILPPARGMRVIVLGQVRSPKQVAFRTGLRLTDAIASAGGVSDLGDDGDIRVVRGPLSHPRIYRASLAALYNGEAHDVILQPGDVLMVTESFIGDFTDVLNKLMPLLLIANLSRSFSQ